MCILFVKLVKSPEDGDFRLILASNRDEFFTRPSKPAHFWEEDENIFGGRDMTLNKEGGTWLALSKKGKLGVLLNLRSKNDDGKLGRGFLVSDYLKTSESGIKHLESLIKIDHQFNKFHLVAIELNENTILNHYSNGDESKKITTILEGTFGISNSPLNEPYEKVKKGKIRFEAIVEQFNKSDKMEQLVEELLKLLKWKEKNPDEILNFASRNSHQTGDQLSLFIDMPSIQYGTRTHTIILSDWNGKMDFFEWTLKEPIDSNNKEWHFTHQQFEIDGIISRENVSKPSAL